MTDLLQVVRDLRNALDFDRQSRKQRVDTSGNHVGHCLIDITEHQDKFAKFYCANCQVSFWVER